MPKNKFSKISSIIKDAKKGKMFILVDDKNRENEGDLIMPGSKSNSKSINFMAMHGRGLICLALTKRQIDNLNEIIRHLENSINNIDELEISSDYLMKALRVLDKLYGKNDFEERLGYIFERFCIGK